MSISQQARELLTQKRQHTINTQDNMLERSEENLQEGTETLLNQQAREVLTQKRQHTINTQENMLERSEAEIK